MIKDPVNFSKFTSWDRGYIKFRDNNNKIINIENINNKSSLLIEDVLLVNDLKYNLMCIS